MVKPFYQSNTSTSVTCKSSNSVWNLLKTLSITPITIYKLITPLFLYPAIDKGKKIPHIYIRIRTKPFCLCQVTILQHAENTIASNKR